MNKNIFTIVHHNFDKKEYFFLETGQDIAPAKFNELCKQLLPQAGYRAFLKKQASEKEEWIFWREVVEALISLLEKQGYQRVSFDHFQIAGNFIIAGSETNDKLGFANHLIMNYNDKLDKKLEKERQAKRFLLVKKKDIQIIK